MSTKISSQNIKTSSLTVVISLALVLFMLGLLGLIVINAKKLSNHIKENVGFQIVLKDTTSAAELDLLKQELSSSPYSKQVDYLLAMPFTPSRAA